MGTMAKLEAQAQPLMSLLMTRPVKLGDVVKMMPEPMNIKLSMAIDFTLPRNWLWKPHVRDPMRLPRMRRLAVERNIGLNCGTNGMNFPTKPSSFFFRDFYIAIITLDLRKHKRRGWNHSSSRYHGCTSNQGKIHLKKNEICHMLHIVFVWLKHLKPDSTKCIRPCLSRPNEIESCKS